VEGSTALIKQMLDIGVKTLLVPMVDTADQAQAIVAATQYLALGVRGVGSAVGRLPGEQPRRLSECGRRRGLLLVQAETTTP
jgi:4-hydroxy-2-oxoheptanedioate aldolase